jgi:hypothetical protein
VGYGTELLIEVMELQVDDAYHSKVVDEKKSWFTSMEVLNFIYHQFLFTTNSLGCQPTISQYFQPPTPQTVALAATAIHCLLSEYASGKKAKILIPHDEYQAAFDSSLLINFTLEATTQSITHQRPLQTPAPSAHLPAVQHHNIWRSTVLVGAP